MTDWGALAASLRAGVLPAGARCLHGDAHEGVFRVGDAAVKLAAAGDEASLAYEGENARWAAALHLGPAVLAVLPEAGVLVTRYVDGVGLTEETVRAPGTLARVAAGLRTVHAGPPIAGAQDLAGDLAYERDGSDLGFDDLEREVWSALARAAPWTPTPCHDDVHPANLVLDARGAIVWLDWAAAAMGDPAWDLAMLASSAHFDAGTWDAWLAAYGATPALAERARCLAVIADLYNLAWHTHRPEVDPVAAGRYRERLHATRVQG